MRNTIPAIVAAASFLALGVLAQQPPAVRLPPAAGSSNQEQIERDLPKFDLEFPGGSPKELIDAISRASGKPLNAIIAEEFANMSLPPLKMKRIDVGQLFDALRLATQKMHVFSNGGTSSSSYGFDTQGPYRDHNSIWFFFHSFPPVVPEAKVCRFFQLGPYLEHYKVEDITTAVQTGWKALGETSMPIINFHKDTKLLIAVGEPSKLQLISLVLSELGGGGPSPEKAKASPPTKQ